ncbi:MAG: Asp-tRNA(Asn)/Glu-tRNA(Gln) amidotransferase subunit GatB [Alphaproteobacteria bacterium]
MAHALLKGETGDWEIVIGLEVHAQVLTKSKLFSGASADFGAAPNAQVSPVDAGMPGMLPVINKECVEKAVRTGLGLNAKINPVSIFERKNYFYPDLPQGYQISQYQYPIVGNGEIEIDLADGTIKKVGIERLHLEQDAGKSLHDQHPTKSYVDLNRSGNPLMEIVSKPDMNSPEEAGAYVTKLRAIVRYLGTCDGNMDEGSMRCDVNVSVRKPGDPLGTRCEIKNVNSVRFVQQAIEYEARRQIEIIEGGGKIQQETRLFDTKNGTTRTMRSKEDAHDYRYFPDPDLLPLTVDAGFVENVRKTMPELPDAMKHRFMKDYGLSPQDAGVLIGERERAEYFEAVAKGRDAKLAANWVLSELLGALHKAEKELKDCPIKPEQLGGLIALISDNTISGRIAKEVFAEMFGTGKSPADIVKDRGLQQVTDTGAIEKIVSEVVKENPDKVAEYKSGKDKLFGFFVGQIMKKSGGKANPGMVNDLLKKKLEE